MATTIRRALLAIVIILILIDGALLASVKFGLGGKPEPSHFDISATVDSVDLAKKVKTALEKEGFKPSTSESKSTKDVPAGYRVVMTNADAVKPFYSTLQHEGVKCKIVKNGTELQLVNTFKSQKLAEATAEKYAKYGFKAEANFKQVPIKVYQLSLKGVPAEEADKAMEIFEQNKVEADRTQSEVASPTPE